MRVVVALYLVIVTAAGPWACCCTFARLTARVAPIASNDQSPTPKPQSCCHHQPQRGNDQDSANQPTPKPHGPLSSDCPCKQGGECTSHALALPHDESRDGTMRALTGEFASALSGTQAVHHVPTPHGVLPSSREYAGGSFLSTDDLLHVLHMLRC